MSTDRIEPNNTKYGRHALEKNVNLLSFNSAFGSRALMDNNVGFSNTAYGAHALKER